MRTVLLMILISLQVLALVQFASCDKANGDHKSKQAAGQAETAGAAPGAPTSGDSVAIGASEFSEEQAGESESAPRVDTPEALAERIQSEFHMVAEKSGSSVDQLNEVLDMAIDMLPYEDLRYDPARMRITHQDVPEFAVLIASVAIETVDYCSKNGVELTPENCEKKVKEIFEVQQGNALDMKEHLEQAAQEIPVATPTKPTPKLPAGFKAAPELTGKWRSIREEQLNSKTVVDHNNDYCDLYTFNDDGTAVIEAIRYGETIKEQHQNYIYDPATSVLQFTSPEGLPCGTYLVMVKDNDDGIFLMQENRTTVKFCVKVGEVRSLQDNRP